MKKIRFMVSALLAIVMLVTISGGCSKKNKNGDTNSTLPLAADKEITTFTAFFAVPGTEIGMDNRVMNAIARVTGANVRMTWLTGQTASERAGVMVAGRQYPDFIDGSAGTPLLLEAGALLPVDRYWDKYPNIKNYLSETDWNKVRKEDGHIYIIPQFGIIQGRPTATNHNGEAFWIQKDALAWDNYPRLTTVDQFFDLVDRYVAAHPQVNGHPTLGFTVCTDDWRYFGLENPPIFLAGYPNDGSCIVDSASLTARQYNSLPEAHDYFKKLNEIYNAGLFDPSAFTDTYNQYISKLSTGCVVSLVDQHWNFQTAEDSLKSQNLYERTYVPQPIVLNSHTVEHWYSPSALDVSNGLGVTTSCKDPDAAFRFINDLLSPEVMTLRFWGEKGIDYQVNSDGIYSRNQQQRENAANTDWVNRNLCSYSYFPQYEGMMADGKNTINPADQPAEFRATLTEVDTRILDVYKINNFLQFLNTNTKNSDWFPMWSYTNTWISDTSYGVAKIKMDQIKHEWLPKVVMTSTAEFEKTWSDYQSFLTSEIDIRGYEDALTAEVRRRVAVAQGMIRK